MPPELRSHTRGLNGQGRMRDFVQALLRYEGALAEPIEPDGLEILAPPHIQRALGVAELSRLGFGNTLPPEAERVGIEGDWLERFGRLLGEHGRSSRRILPTAARPPGDPERVLGNELVLDNATYRLLGVTPTWTRYLILDFRASAVSDDKRDFVVRLGVNLATGVLPDVTLAAITPALDTPAEDFVTDEGPDGQMPGSDGDLPPIWDRPRVLELVAQALPPRLEAALTPFIKGLRRRLGRDQDRLYHYHNDLHGEAVRRTLGLPEDDPRRQREERRAEAIAREYRAKLDDLSRQYATRVTVDWVQTLELVMPVHRFEVRIRRRKAERVLLLDWNSLARRLEPPSCEFTASTERPRLVCDDALHLVVPSALGPCQTCARTFCRACYPQRCPKCAAEDLSARLRRQLTIIGAQASDAKPPSRQRNLR